MYTDHSDVLLIIETIILRTELSWGKLYSYADITNVIQYILAGS
jgi:hypothetical protein